MDFPKQNFYELYLADHSLKQGYQDISQSKKNSTDKLNLTNNTKIHYF